jgi:hypothetical protein
MKRLLVLLLLSVAISVALFFINSSVIESTWADKISEIGVLTIPIFILVCLLYYINRAMVRKVRGIAKKKPSENGKV